MSDVFDELEGFKDLTDFRGEHGEGDIRKRSQKQSADNEPVERNALSTRMYKLRKKIHPDQIEEMEAMGETELRERISKCECNVLESEKAKAADEDLRVLKEKLKEANAPYSEVKRVQRAIAEYAACLLDTRGVT